MKMDAFVESYVKKKGRYFFVLLCGCVFLFSGIQFYAAFVSPSLWASLHQQYFDEKQH